MGNVKSLIKRSKLRSLSSITLSYLLNHRDVHFTKEEIEEWYQEYQSSLDEGVTRLSVNVFRKVYDRVFIGDASTFAHHLFRSFDLDGDGYVDFQEFIIGLCVSASSNPEKKVRWAFRMYDIDGNGKISRNEMVTILQVVSIFCLLQKLWKINLLTFFGSLITYVSVRFFHLWL